MAGPARGRGSQAAHQGGLVSDERPTFVLCGVEVEPGASGGAAYVELQRKLPDAPFYPVRRIPVGAAGLEERWHWSCPAMTAAGGCTKYDNRPAICRRYLGQEGYCTLIHTNPGRFSWLWMLIWGGRMRRLGVTLHRVTGWRSALVNYGEVRMPVTFARSPWWTGPSPMQRLVERETRNR